MSNLTSYFDAHEQAITALRTVLPTIERCGQRIADTLRAGHKILICGNGGSAGDAQHFAAELSGRFERERRGLPGIALTTDSSALTAIANDYGFEHLFARQVEALGQEGDLLVGISTSGNSANVVAAVQRAQALGLSTIGLSGRDGGQLAELCDDGVTVPSPSTARIQECHLLVIHCWCAMVDEACTP